LWRLRKDFTATVLLGLTVGVTVAWQFILLDRDPSWLPWLRYGVLVVGTAVALLMLVITRLARRVGTAVASVALVACLAAPAAYSVATAATVHTGSIPSSGPSGSGGFGGGPGGGARAGGRAAGGGFGGGFGMAPPGTGAAGGTRTFGGGGGGGAGGLLNASTPSAAVISALKADASRYTWVAAAVGSNSAAGFQLATGEPVMPIGGFNGSDPSPTLAQFKAYVGAGAIHYFIASGGGLGSQRGGSSASADIASWIESNYTATTIGGVTLYDLTK
jgi:hypothetical protein